MMQPAFRIVAVERLKYGSLVAAATIAVSGFGKFDICIFAPVGKPAFAKPRSIGDEHKRTFWLEPVLAEAFCAAVLERLAIATPTPIARKAEQPEPAARRRPKRLSRPAPSTPARFATTAERDAYLDRQEQALEQRLRSL